MSKAIKSIYLFAVLFLASPLSIKAESNYLKRMLVQYGMGIGRTQTACKLYEAGVLTKESAKPIVDWAIKEVPMKQVRKTVQENLMTSKIFRSCQELFE